MIVVAIIGILAAVAIPAFMKYIKKSRSSEAGQFLKKISDSSRAYFMAPKYTDGAEVSSLTATVKIRQFPDAVTLTPDSGCCAAGGSNAKCSPADGDWAQASWEALDFRMVDPHYYAYAYEGGGTTSNFTAKATGDLDCDGTTSLFTLYAEVVDGEVQSAGDVIKQRALE